MKKTALAALFVTVAVTMTGLVSADRYDRAVDDNPFRLVRYVVQPVGIALEYAIMRPIHWAVSQPDLDIVFGHKATTRDDGKYFEWSHGDFSPSIGEERPQAPKAAKPASARPAPPKAPAPKAAEAKK